MSDGFQKRFSGIGRLYGSQGLERIRAAHICVIGIGGVGVWAAEALARSGLGSITLVDLDDLCPSNTNRQLHALESTYGQMKVVVMAQRIREINPECSIHTKEAFFTANNADSLLDKPYDCIVDAIDSVQNKCLLISGCKARGIPLVTTAGAGGRLDPTCVRADDLTKVINDPLAFIVRKKLRKEFGFPRDLKEPFGVPCVYSTERPLYPQADGSVSHEHAAGADYRLNCDYGFGTSTAVTGAFGFAAAAQAIKIICK